MELGYLLGYWSAGPPDGLAARLEELRALGVTSLWTSETYGSDALTPLAWWGSRHPDVRLGTAIMQLSARTPTAAAMAALTLDHLSGGRVALGLGVSGPQVVEGWYGDDYRRPLQRTREYVDVVRQVLRREAPVAIDGHRYQLPLDGGMGLGKALRPNVRPLRADLPILLAAQGPHNVALAAEIADGWLTFLYSPWCRSLYDAPLQEGFARRDPRLCPPDEFEVVMHVDVVVGDDVEAAADRLRPRLALYIGGMGARGANFHHDVVCRMGFADAAGRIQELYLAGRTDDAVRAVPTGLVEQLALVGPPDKIAAELEHWRTTPATTLVVSGDLDGLRVVAGALAEVVG